VRKPISPLSQIFFFENQKEAEKFKQLLAPTVVSHCQRQSSDGGGSEQQQALIANHARSNDGEQAWGIEERYKKAWRVAVPWPPGRRSARLLLLLVSKTRLAFMWTVAIFSVDLGVCDVWLLLPYSVILRTVGKNISFLSSLATSMVT
jgi:hypothetical protein